MPTGVEDGESILFLQENKAGYCRCVTDFREYKNKETECFTCLRQAIVGVRHI